MLYGWICGLTHFELVSTYIHVSYIILKTSVTNMGFYFYTRPQQDIVTPNHNKTRFLFWLVKSSCSRYK